MKKVASMLMLLAGLGLGMPAMAEDAPKKEPPKAAKKVVKKTKVVKKDTIVKKDAKKVAKKVVKKKAPTKTDKTE